MGIRNISLLRGLYFLLICLFVQTSNAEKTLFSIDSHSSPVAVRAYEIEGNIIKDPVTISEDLFGYGPVGAAVSEKLGLLFVTYEAADIVPVFRCRTLDLIHKKHAGLDISAAAIRQLHSLSHAGSGDAGQPLPARGGHTVILYLCFYNNSS